MILVHVFLDSVEEANELADLLLLERLILTATIHENTVRKKLEDGKIVSKNQVLLLGKSKSLLFKDIEETIKKKYGDDLPSLYSMPIVQMEWGLSEQLKSRVI